MSPITGIRKQAFQDEMRYAVKELHRIYGNKDSYIPLQTKLEEYLEKNFVNYIGWHFVISTIEIIFDISGISELDFTRFTIQLGEE